MIEKIVPFSRDTEIVKAGTTYITKRGTRITVKSVGIHNATFIYAKTGREAPRLYTLNGLGRPVCATPDHPDHIVSRVITDVEVLPFEAGTDTLVEGETYRYGGCQCGVATKRGTSTEYHYHIGLSSFTAKGQLRSWSIDSSVDVTGRVVEKTPTDICKAVVSQPYSTVPLSVGEELVLGVTYETRGGDLVTLRRSGYEAYPFKGSNGSLYYPNGRYNMKAYTKHDLVYKMVPTIQQAPTTTPIEKHKISLQKQYTSLHGTDVRILVIDEESSKLPVIYRHADSDSVFSCDEYGYSDTRQVLFERDPRLDLKLDDKLWVRQRASEPWKRACYRKNSVNSSGVVVYSQGKNSHTGSLLETFMQFTTTNPEEQQ